MSKAIVSDATDITARREMGTMTKRKRKRKKKYRHENSYILDHAEILLNIMHGIDRRDNGTGGGKKKANYPQEWPDHLRD